MKRYVCTVCGYVYEETAGTPEQGIAPGTKWEDLPEDWECTVCGASKAEFKEQTSTSMSSARETAVQPSHKDVMREMSWGELNALCSNLAKGCEKQYRPEEAALFDKLAKYYEGKSDISQVRQFDQLLAAVQQDLDQGYPRANIMAAAQRDRGGLRALVWGEKVTRILSSLLKKHEKQGDALLESTNVFVCEICGFVYIGDEPPEICPVCKVPRMKIRRIEREAV